MSDDRLLAIEREQRRLAEAQGEMVALLAELVKLLREPVQVDPVKASHDQFVAGIRAREGQ